MSYVYNYILTARTEMPEMIAVPCATCGHDRFEQVDLHAGGHKVLEHDVALLATNYVGPEEVCRAIVAAPWGDPESVQLMYRSQDMPLLEVLEWRGILECAKRGA